MKVVTQKYYTVIEEMLARVTPAPTSLIMIIVPKVKKSTIYV